MPLLITTDIGQVKVGDVVLPGVFESIEISAAVKLDEVEIKGKEQKITQAVGYDNARVRITINLLPDEEGGECYDQIAAIQQVFRGAPDQETPGVYQIVNKHTGARNINEVVFSDLKTWEDNKSDKVMVICEFIEHVPVTVQVAEQTAAEQASSGTTQTTSPSGYGELRESESPATVASTGFGDFRMLEIQDKTEETPAVDDRQPGLGARILAWLRGSNDV